MWYLGIPIVKYISSDQFCCDEWVDNNNGYPSFVVIVRVVGLIYLVCYSC